ncbi:fasciclin domain-containing protein [Pedobacter steynii]|uniref:Fasciclin n=1 Tax=Pedobacter steynii TaxID=430522 RepID=A0A1D7QQ43_9SPHI|nr:fasciclin domain-containing protein [Pedobacter steynii]AOM80792.1 fasciclin [Pedobacter steynii]
MNNFKYILMPVLALSVSLSACKKEEKQSSGKDSNKISAVIADNFNLSVFSTGLNRSGLKAKMQETGPFTVIAPSDDAFLKAGFANAVAILSAEPSRISAIMNYHLLNGTYELNKLPFLFNQEIRSANGGKLFVTHWVKGPDTVLTINGSRVLSQNIRATNGLIQVVDQMLEPYTHELVTEAIASDRSLSLFYQAIQRSGLMTVLNGKGSFTVFAPENAAMAAYGLSSLADINAADPATLAALMRYHIITDRRFVYDYILSTSASGKSDQTMLDGNSIQIQLIPNENVPGAFTGIRLQGTGNTAFIAVKKQDVLTGNGVLHTITGMLKITQ